MGCVLLGEPAFYRRFGFEPDDGLRYEDAPPEFFLRLNLIGRAAPFGKVDIIRRSQFGERSP